MRCAVFLVLILFSNATNPRSDSAITSVVSEIVSSNLDGWMGEEYQTIRFAASVELRKLETKVDSATAVLPSVPESAKHIGLVITHAVKLRDRLKEFNSTITTEDLNQLSLFLLNWLQELDKLGETNVPGFPIAVIRETAMQVTRWIGNIDGSEMDRNKEIRRFSNWLLEVEQSSLDQLEVKLEWGLRWLAIEQSRLKTSALLKETTDLVRARYRSVLKFKKALADLKWKVMRGVQNGKPLVSKDELVVEGLLAAPSLANSEAKLQVELSAELVEALQKYHDTLTERKRTLGFYFL